MTIVITDNATILLFFMVGMAFGVFFCWMLMNNKAELEADRRNEYNFELWKLRLDYAVAKREMEERINKPPKPPPDNGDMM